MPGNREEKTIKTSTKKHLFGMGIDKPEKIYYYFLEWIFSIKA